MRCDPATRRQFLRAAGRLSGLAGAGVLAGCLDGETEETSVPGAAATIEVDPDGSLRYVPSEVAILKGETVVWLFRTSGHNISANPDHARKAEIPAGARPFATYENGDEQDTVPPGDRFSHTFDTTGEWQYVCIPHADDGMVGEVTVE